MSYNYQLYFGLKVSANLLNVDFSKLNVYNPEDVLFQYNIDNKFSPNVGAGLYLQSDRSYFGVSVPYILATKHFKHSQISTADEKMHLYFMGGYVFDMTYNLRFKPAILAKVVSGAPLQFDLSANFLYNEVFTFGLAYRFNAAVSALVGFQILDDMFLGYSYDADTTGLGSYNSGSHEI